MNILHGHAPGYYMLEQCMLDAFILVSRSQTTVFHFLFTGALTNKNVKSGLAMEDYFYTAKSKV